MLCMVHGKWIFISLLFMHNRGNFCRWFVWGSVISTLLPILVLLHDFIGIYEVETTLPALTYYVTWIIMVLNGFFMTLGSLAFVRAFEEPPKPPMFTWKHISSDELVAAWLMFLSMLIMVPYTLMWFFLYPNEVLYIGSVIGSAFLTFCTYLFVLACYPSEKVCTRINFHIRDIY